MQREIKFRIWTGKEMISWDKAWNLEAQIPKEFGEEKFLSIIILAFLAKGNGELTAQQFTGLKDRNGKEIYEGDILLIPNNDPTDTGGNSFVVVEYHGSGFTYRDLYTNQIDTCFGLIGIAEQDDMVEIIGNIFENPKLLEKT